MRMKVQFNNSEAYLAVEVAGPYCLDVMIALIDSIAGEAAALQARYVLVDVSKMTGDASVTERFQYATYAAAKLANLIKCAACAGDQQQVVPFTETVAQNRSLDLRVFRQRADAANWLLQGRSELRGGVQAATAP